MGVNIQVHVSYDLTFAATVDDWRRVAAQVHWDTMVVAVRPTDTRPPASKLKSNIVCKDRNDKAMRGILLAAVF